MITRTYNFTLSGNPSFTDGPTGGLALLLNGIDDFVDLGDLTNGCLGDIEKCKFGLSIKFNLKVLELKQNMYIFSNGGDEVGKYGYSMWYRNKRLYLTVSTSTKIWTVYVPFKKYLNTFVNIEFSWSVQGGLELYFDGLRVAHTKVFYRRTTIAVVSSLFYFGRPISTGVWCNMVIDGWDIAEGTKDMVKNLNVTVGKYLYNINTSVVLLNEVKAYCLTMCLPFLFNMVSSFRSTHVLWVTYHTGNLVPNFCGPYQLLIIFMKRRKGMYL